MMGLTGGRKGILAFGRDEFDSRLSNFGHTDQTRWLRASDAWNAYDTLFRHILDWMDCMQMAKRLLVY